MSKRGLLLLTVTSICWTSVVASSQAAVVFRAEGPSALSLPGTQTVTYSLRMTSGADPEQFTVGLDLPLLRGPDGLPGGVSIAPIGAPTLTGPGSAGLATVTNFDGAAGLSCRGGISSGTVHSPQISLPPFSDSRLTTQFAVAGGYPRLGDSYAPTFVARSALNSGGTGTIGPDQRITPSEPMLSPKPSGVDITLHTLPSTTPSTDPVAVELRRGARIRFTGSTNPPTPNQLVRISYSFDAEAERTIAEVRTNGAGRFFWPPPIKAKAKKASKKAGWRPSRLGGYGLSTVLMPQSGNLGPSRSCGRFFVLEKKFVKRKVRSRKHGRIRIGQFRDQG